MGTGWKGDLFSGFWALHYLYFESTEWDIRLIQCYINAHAMAYLYMLLLPSMAFLPSLIRSSICPYLTPCFTLTNVLQMSCHPHLALQQMQPGLSEVLDPCPRFWFPLDPDSLGSQLGPLLYTLNHRTHGGQRHSLGRSQTHGTPSSRPGGPHWGLIGKEMWETLLSSLLPCSNLHSERLLFRFGGSRTGGLPLNEIISAPTPIVLACLVNLQQLPVTGLPVKKHWTGQWKPCSVVWPFSRKFTSFQPSKGQPQ